MIRDSKADENSDKTAWRHGGESAPRDTPFQMRVILDLNSSFIDWYVEDSIVASAKLPDMFGQGFRVVFSLFNTEDSVLLNEEDWKDRLRLGKFDKASYILENREGEEEKFGKIRRFEGSPVPSEK